MTLTEQEKERVQDRVDLVAGRIDDELHAEYQEATKTVREYAEHLIAGGSAINEFRYGGRFQKLRYDHSKELDDARREALGLHPNPWGPAKSHGYRLFDYMVGKDGEFTPAAQIVTDVPESAVGSYNYNVESRLDTRDLREAGWRVEKKKINGKVAYRIVRADEEGGEQDGAVAG